MSIHLDFSEQKRLQIYQRYLAGESPTKLSVEYGCSRKFINRNAKDHAGIRHRRRHPLDESAFFADTPEALYWAGFLFSDGSIDDKGTVTVRLAATDAAQIYAFRDFVKSGHAVQFNNFTGSDGRYREQVAIRFRAGAMTQDLRRFGIVPGKTFSSDLPYINSRDFWRGMVDGDGYVMVRERPKSDLINIGLCGHYEVVDKFLRFVSENGIVTKARPFKNNTIFGCDLGGNKARQAITLLYANACYALPRKLAVAHKVLSL